MTLDQEKFYMTIQKAKDNSDEIDNLKKLYKSVSVLKGVTIFVGILFSLLIGLNSLLWVQVNNLKNENYKFIKEMTHEFTDSLHEISIRLERNDASHKAIQKDMKQIRKEIKELKTQGYFSQKYLKEIKNGKPD